MLIESYLSYSFILFFGGLVVISLLLLYKSFKVANNKGQLQAESDALPPWHTPNLKSWAHSLYIILYWIRDISFRHWAVNLLRNLKMLLYKILRSIHKYLLGVIKSLERHEHNLKSRLSEKEVLSTEANEERLIKTLSKKSSEIEVIEDEDL